MIIPDEISTVPNVVIPVIESDVPTILVSVVIPETLSCWEVRLVVVVTPNVVMPVTVKEETIPTLRVVIPVMLAFLAVNSSKTKSSVTYKSPPTYKVSRKSSYPNKSRNTRNIKFTYCRNS